MIDGYNEIISYEEDNWEDFLKEIALFHIFSPLFFLTKDKPTLKGMIRYIVWTYSKKSDKLMLEMEWGRNKRNIFDECNLHHQYAEMFVDLKSEAVIKVINLWIEFQDEDISLQLTSLKDLKREMQAASNSPITKGTSGEIDYDQKFKNAQYVIELREMIKKVESELVQSDQKLKKGVQEVVIAKAKNTFGIEKFT